MSSPRRMLPLGAIAFLLVATLPAAPQASAKSQPDTIQPWPGKWDVHCMTKGCVMFTDVLIGDPDHPADLAHPQFITIAVAINRSDRKPAFFDFDFPPDADRGQGAFVAFAHREKFGSRWKLAIAKATMFHLSFFTCDADSCIGRVTGHIVPARNGDPPVDVLHQFLTDDQILFLFTRKGVPYRTIKTLLPFQHAYQHLMKTELKAPAKQ